MASTIKSDFIQQFEKIKFDIQTKNYANIYFAYGKESYFIDQLQHTIENEILDPADKDFNLYILYGKDTTIPDIINIAESYSFFGNYKVISIREAQELSFANFDLFEKYFQKPMSQTILFFAYKDEKLNSKWQALLNKKTSKVIKFNSKGLYNYQIPNFIEDFAKQKGYKINPHITKILADNLGTNLSVVTNELEKLFILVPSGGEITMQIVEDLTGINRQYNVYELQNSLAQKDIKSIQNITLYLASSDERSSLLIVIQNLFNFFTQLLIYKQNIKGKTEAELLKLMHLSHAFFLKQFQIADKNYSITSVINIISLLREYDLKAKGVGNRSFEQQELLKELIVRILNHDKNLEVKTQKTSKNLLICLKISKRDKYWIPPLKDDEKKMFSPDTIPELGYCDTQFGWQKIMIRP
jgi:DNA polymerase-3 subunit delta